MDPTTEQPKIKQVHCSAKDAIANKLKLRISKLEDKLGKYSSIVEELKLLKASLHALGVSTYSTPSQPIEKFSDPADLCYDANNTTPLSVKGMQFLERLPKEFTTQAIVVGLGNNKMEAYQYIAAWKRAGKIGTVSRGVYNKIL